MNNLYEYSLALLVCCCLMRETIYPCIASVVSRYTLEPFACGHRLWTEHLQRSYRQGWLGQPRIDHRSGRLCVVGLGQCRFVSSIEEGIQTIRSLENQIAGLFAA